MNRDEKEQTLLMAEELATRRRDDPLKNFPLHKKQKPFVRSVLEGQKKENWFIASNRSGKSEAGAYIGATLARFGRQNPPSAPFPGAAVEVRDRATSGWVSALDFPTSRDVIQPKYFDNGFGLYGKHPPFIPKHEIQAWRIEDQILKLKNGSIIGFKSAESGRAKYQGAGKDWFHMDEEHPWAIYEEAVIRVSEKPLLFFCTATLLPPEGEKAPTVSWVYEQIIRPYLDGKSPHIGLFGASIYDNPGIPRDEIARLEAIYPLGSPSRRIRLEGEWLPGMGGARAYQAFDRTVHVRSDFPPLSSRRPLLWTWDFNVEPMVSLVLQCAGDVYRVYKELVLDEGSVPEMCDLFVYHFPEHGSEIWLYGDATGKGRTGQTGKSDYWTILNEMRRYRCPIKMNVPEENPRIPDRVNAVNRLLKDEMGYNRLLIDAGCSELIKDLEGVKRDQKGGIMKVRNKRDPYFKRTHTSDALGYLISWDEPVRLITSAQRMNERMRTALAGPVYGRTKL